METTDRRVLAFENWRKQRAESLTGPLGNLALRETRWLTAYDTLTAEEAGANEPETVTVTKIEREHIVTGEPERGLRFWDAHSPAIQAFQGIKTFDFDPSWILRGTFEPAPEGRTIPFEHLRDNGLSRELVVPGDIHVNIAGAQYNLSAYDDDGRLLITFADLTNKETDPESKTYPAGRFLFVDWADGSDRARGGEVILDFNRAFIPPCGFSDAFNCPLPPPQNRINSHIRAGEIKMLTSQPQDH